MSEVVRLERAAHELRSLLDSLSITATIAGSIKVFLEFPDIGSMHAARMKIMESLSPAMMYVAPDNPRWINSKTIEIQCGGISFVLTCEIKFVSADGKGMGYRDMRFVTLDTPLAGRKGE